MTLWFTAAAALAFAANVHLGTWKLNQAKSKFETGTRNDTVTYAPAKGDMIKLIVDGKDKDGKPIHWTWMGKFDGQPSRVNGNMEADMLAIEKIDNRTNKITTMKNGKAVATSMITVSKDGLWRRVTTTGTDANGKKFTDKAYYDKR